MINFKESNITRILPDVLNNTPEVKSIGYAINKQINKVLNAIEKVNIWSNIEGLNSKILDVLAAELRTHYYDETLPVEIKRKLVINTIYRYQMAGTPAIVEELLSIIFGNGEIHEWFEYGGEPHHFKVSTQSSLAVGEKADDFLRLLESIKRKSSHLDAVEIVDVGKQKFYIGVISRESEVVVQGGYKNGNI